MTQPPSSADLQPAADSARAALAQLVEERREDYAGLSRLIGRNPAYIQQYIKRGSPRRLAERDRRILARYFDVEEEVLGGPAALPAPRLVPVPQLAVGASAGAGALGGEERAVAHLGFDPAWLRRITRGGDPVRLALIRVEGDSMVPTLADGDDILVDGGDGTGQLRDGIYVLRLEGALMVKRLAVNPGRRSVAVKSDNPDYPSFPECSAAEIDLVGRVVWAGRVLR